MAESLSGFSNEIGRKAGFSASPSCSDSSDTGCCGWCLSLLCAFCDSMPKDEADGCTRIVLPSLAMFAGLDLARLMSVVLLVDDGCKMSLALIFEVLCGSSCDSLPLIFNAVWVAYCDVSRASSFG